MAVYGIDAPVQPLNVNPIDTITPAARMASLTALNGQNQLIPGNVQAQQLENQQRQQQIAQQAYTMKRTQAVDAAFQGAYTQDENGQQQLDQDKLVKGIAQAGYGSAAPEIAGSLVKWHQAEADLAKTSQDMKVKSIDMMGNLAYAAHQAGDDPHILLSGLGALAKSDPTAAPLVQQLMANPGMAPQVIQHLMGQSPEVQKILNEKTTADAKKAESENAAKHLDAEMPGGALNRVQQDIQIATNPQIQAGKEKVAAAEGAARANLEAQVARGSQAALANVPPHLVAQATEQATKAGSEYAQATSVTERLKEMMDAAKNGNVVSYQLIPQEGALQLTTSQGVKRINMAEIQNYGGGSLWQRMEGHIGKTLTGKSIPDSVLKDMQEMQDIQAKGAQTKYANTLKTINQNFGSTFKPVEMDNGPVPKTVTMKAPNGQTKQVSPDEVDHYKKLGAVLVTP